MIKKIATINIKDEDLEFVLKQNRDLGFWSSIKRNGDMNIVNTYFVERSN